jgi:cytoskeletal protein CcmA (bactofilin family)
MWNKRREDEPQRSSYNPPGPVPAGAAGPAKPVYQAPNPVETKKETALVSTSRVEPDRGNAATIGKAVKVVGQIYSKEDLYVDGDLEGTVEAMEHKVTIGPNGTAHASVKAREVVALGTIQGNVEATDKIEIRKDARLVGDIRTARIIIEDGAYFKGSIDIVKPEPVKAAAKPPQTPPPPAAVMAPQVSLAAVENNR